MNGDDLRNLDARVTDAVRTSPHAARLMRTLCHEIGPRPPASPAMRTAQQLLMNEFRGLGATDAGTEPVDVFAWTDHPATLEVQRPGNDAWASFHVYQHVHTASGTVEGELVDAGYGTGRELDVLGSRCRGAIALAHTYDKPGAGGAFVSIQQRFSALWERGAIGIVARGLPGTGLPQVELVGVSADAPIPVVGVSAEIGEGLAAAIASGGRPARARMTTAGESRRDRCANLVATLGPSEAANAIVLSAHLDTFENNPGALDNLTGVLTLVEIARALAPHQTAFRRPLRLVVFTGEEYGFLGSKAYVARHRRTLSDLALVFNMDTLFPATARGIAVMGSPELRGYFDRHARAAGIEVDVRNLFCMSSDYLPFVLEGIPAARPAQWFGEFPAQSHTTADVPERLPIEWITENAATHGPLLLRALLDPEPLPGRRNTPAEVNATLAREDVILQLRLYDFAL